MAFQLKNRVRDTSTTTGTGTYTLDETPPVGYQGFDALTTGRTLHYCAVLSTGWEVGIGTITVGGTVTLTRDTILDSSNSGAAVNWGAGDKDIFLVSIAEILEALEYVGGVVAAAFGSLSLITALPIASGGTGSQDAAAARTALGVELGVDVQAFDTELAELAALANTDGNFIVGDGAVWLVESGATARASLGLAALAIKATINDDDWSGTDLAVANGGTGASDAAGAQTNLGVPPNARDLIAGEHITGGGDLSADRTFDLTDMAEERVIGRAAAAGTGAPQDLTPAQLKAILDTIEAFQDIESSGSFTGTLTGTTGTPTATFLWIKSAAGIVRLWLDGNTGLFGTSDTTQCSLTGIPAAITPVASVWPNLIVLQDNSVGIQANAEVTSSNIIVFSVGSPFDGSGFTAANSKGITPGFHITYNMD